MPDIEGIQIEVDDCPDPERRVWLLEGFRLHRRAIELPEAASEGNAQHAFISCSPSLCEAGDEAGRVYLES